MKRSHWTRWGPIFSAFSVALFLLVYSQVQPQVVTLRASATVAQIIIDPENPAATEVTVNEGNTVQLNPRLETAPAM